MQKRFKYISCSYLSNYDCVNHHFRNRFKYISCSYLSKEVALKNKYTLIIVTGY